MDYQKVAEGACAKIEEAVAKFALKELRLSADGMETDILMIPSFWLQRTEKRSTVISGSV